MNDKLHKEVDPEETENKMQKTRKYLRSNAKQVKQFEFDQNFTEQIACYERKDMSKKGYKSIKRVFKSFKELKEFYDQLNDKKPSKKPASIRGYTEKRRGRPKKKMAKSKSQKTNGR